MHKPLIGSNPVWSAVACAAVGLCLVAGVAGSDVHLAQTLKDAKVYAALAAVLGVLAVAAVPLRANPVGLLSFAFTLLSLQFVGVASIIGIAAFGLASAAVGRRVGRRFGMDDVLVSTFIGVFVLTGVIGWLLPYKVHTRLIYMTALAALLWFERRAVREILAGAWRGWTDAISGSKASASLALVLVIVSSTTAWLPSVMFDDLAYHLMLPTQLRHLGYYRFDVATQVWAMAPWGSDIVHAVVSVLADADSRGAVNLGWFALACWALWRLGTLVGLGRHWKWLAIALYASQPYISGLMGTAQVENELVPLTLVLAALCIRVCRDKEYEAIYAMAILAGLFASLKSSQALVILPLVLVCAPALRRVELRKLLGACAIALIFFSSSYVYAWYLAGNPLLPLFNSYFKSPFFPDINFHDSRWSQGLNWRTLWDLTFHTDRFQETYPGGAGISVLALSPFLLATLWIAGLRHTAIWLLVALIGMFGAIQYLRYIAPLLVVSIPLALYATSRFLTPRIATVAVTGLILVNLLLIPASIWILKNDLLRLQLSSLTKKSTDDANQRILENYAFESVAADFLLKEQEGIGSVLLTNKERPFSAPFAGLAFAESWYDTEVQAASISADADPTGVTWTDFLKRNGIRYVLAKTGIPDRPALATAIRDRMTVAMAGPGFTLYCLCDVDPKAMNVGLLYKQRDLSARARLHLGLHRHSQ